MPSPLTSPLTLQSFFEYTRGLARDNYNSGEFTDTDLTAPFHAAWSKVMGILEKSRAPVVTGWIHAFLPAHGSVIPLHLHGYLGGCSQLMTSVAAAWSKITTVSESIDGTIITVDATAGLIAAGLTSGKSILLVDVDPSLRLNGSYTVSLGDPPSDQALLIPGYRIREDATFTSADPGTRARAVFCAQDFAPMPAVTSQTITQGGNTQPSYANLSPWQDQFRGWAFTNGGIQIPVSDQNRVVAIRGVYGTKAPASLSDEIPDKIVEVLAHTVLGYATQTTDPLASARWLTKAFGPGQGDTEPYLGFMDMVLTQEMVSAQAEIVRPDAAGDFFRGQA